ncbi:hypothetical protein GAGA_3107 [Paraglaciecola agarilytica NO2]|uniref:Uncharacterized protein n=1 Tax=Paraglaciecola agarilytica NO2 TaxID=1125747 RepID=A0ABQ0I987_9ALTE|nr:hypothetical protein GAGA_3107 [Paraglaciecola agarilytica NO2]
MEHRSIYVAKDHAIRFWAEGLGVIQGHRCVFWGKKSPAKKLG